jgi:hypothetical protein
MTDDGQARCAIAHDRNMTIRKFAPMRPARGSMAALRQGGHRSARGRPFLLLQPMSTPCVRHQPAIT